MQRALLLLLTAAACSSAPRDEASPVPPRVKDQEKVLAVERGTRRFSDVRPVAQASEEDRREFERVWTLFHDRSPRWPAERDRFLRRGEACGYLLAAFLLRTYHAVNQERERYARDLLRVRDEIIAVGQPCAPFLVDWMILDEIRVPSPDRKGEARTFLTDDITRQDCVAMLGGMRGAAIPDLLRALARKDLGPKARRHLAQALGGTRDPRAYDPLVKLLKEDDSWQVRADAAGALAELGDRRALVPLREAIQTDADPAVVKRAGRARAQLEGRRTR
ncbi:MAG: HEAT repeat domain-containing protein [Planctomycetaceae bacterium]